MLILNKQRSAVLAMISAASAFNGMYSSTTDAFVPAIPRQSTRVGPLNSSFLAQQRMVTGRQIFNTKKARGTATTALRMSSDDFNEQKYTEAGWAVVAALTKAADFYQTSTVESPILLSLLLNPGKHKAGDDAESARKAVEKVEGCQVRRESSPTRIGYPSRPTTENARRYIFPTENNGIQPSQGLGGSSQCHVHPWRFVCLC